jgi:hypothetical protein
MLSALVYLTLGALLARSHEKNRIKFYFLLTAALMTLVGVSRCRQFRAYQFAERHRRIIAVVRQPETASGMSGAFETGNLL